jgi:thiol-disulfide isomerase/thioredoxin
MAMALAVAGACLGCDDSSTATTTAVAPTEVGPTKVDWVAAPAGEEPVSAIVTREVERARGEGREVLVYVGATWCEPCTRFHDAAMAGRLDATFPTLRFLEFDADRDDARLEAAGCKSGYIPLFARPTSDGRCDPSRRHAGGVKGPSAVAFLTVKLQAMLAKGPS